MRAIVEGESVCLAGARVDLDLTAHSGQAFLWRRQEEGYLICAEGRRVMAQSTPQGLRLTPCTLAEATYWNHYFDLDSDYAAQLSGVLDAPLAACVAAFPGLRLLRQPFFETLCAFIISANNNIGRITGIMRRLEAQGADGFPTPQELAALSVDGLRALGLGYRAPYLAKTARRVLDGFPTAQQLGALPYEEAAAQLRTLPGVGEKVADCVLLFACDHRAAFPVDVWVERALRAWYGFGGTRAHLKRLAMDRFGPCAGLAQQYLFHAARMGLHCPTAALPGA